MRNIALLIRKDVKSSITSYGYYLIIVLLLLAIAPVSPGMLPLMTTIIVYVFVLALFQQEENELVCNIRAILPIRRRQTVIARYLYLYLLLASIAVFICITCPLVNLLRGRQSEWVSPLFLAIGSCLILCSVAFPMMYHFGVGKMRMIIFVLYMVVVMTGSATSDLLIKSVGVLSTFPVHLLLALLVAAGMALSLISMAVSIKLAK